MAATTLLLLLLLGLGAGCARESRGTGGSAPATPPRIELLGFPDCPHTPPMRERLADAVRRIGPGWTFSDVDLTRLPPEDPRRGYPAPTILVDGRDLFGLPAPLTADVACRVYPGGLPTSDLLVERLRARTTR